MSRSELRKLAAQFREPAGDQPVTETAATDVDLTAEINRRIAESRSDDTTEVTEADEPTQAHRSAEPAARTSTPMPAASPQPALRDTNPRRRVPVDIPMVFEDMRRDAKAQGITLTSLVLAAVRRAGPALRERAEREGIPPVPAEGFKRWTLLVSDDELAELDDLTEALERALGRRSRARTIALALQHT